MLNATEVLVDAGLAIKDASHALKSALKQADNELADECKLDHHGYQKMTTFTVSALTKLDTHAHTTHQVRTMVVVKVHFRV